MNLKSFAALSLVASVVPLASAGPFAYAVCQTGCNALVVSCYGAAGFVFGVAVVAAPPAIVACNAGLGTCMAACAAVTLVAPIP